jgi:hypothetical protein
VLEIVLIAPFAVLVMVILIGLGQTLVLRQHALVAARYAAYYQRITGNSPSTLSKEVSYGDEHWQLTAQSQDSGGDVLSKLSLTGGGVGSLFGSLVSTLGSASGQGGTIHPSAKVTPRGLVPGLFRLSDVSAEYWLPNGSWTSENCGSFVSLLLDKVSFFGFKVHF